MLGGIGQARRCDEGRKNVFYGIHCNGNMKECPHCKQTVCDYHRVVNPHGAFGGHSNCRGAAPRTSARAPKGDVRRASTMEIACPACTMLNSADDTACQMCETLLCQAPSGPVGPVVAQQIQIACTACTMLNSPGATACQMCETRLCQAPSGPLGPAVAQRMEIACPACTILNSSGATACQMCDTRLCQSPGESVRPIVVEPIIREGLAVRNSTQVLVFNCGLLRFNLLGHKIFENPPFADERFPLICKAIKNCGADIVALSEIYEDQHVRELLRETETVYPYHARGDTRSPLERHTKCHNGLLFLSKTPLEGTAARAHVRTAGLEKALASKAMLVTQTSTESLGKLFLVNMHTTAGGGINPEGDQVDSIRQSELEEAVDECAHAALHGTCKPIILGDLNMGPEASPSNYAFMSTAGYTDSVAACTTGRVHSIVTWDPANPLNAAGPHARSPPQRCDHLFVHENAGIVASSVQVVFSEAVVATSRGEVTLSDHYGLLVTLQKSDGAQ